MAQFRDLEESVSRAEHYFCELNQSYPQISSNLSKYTDLKFTCDRFFKQCLTWIDSLVDEHLLLRCGELLCFSLADHMFPLISSFVWFWLQAVNLLGDILENLIRMDSERGSVPSFEVRELTVEEACKQLSKNARLNEILRGKLGPDVCLSCLNAIMKLLTSLRNHERHSKLNTILWDEFKNLIMSNLSSTRCFEFFQIAFLSF
jgi:hypothetical protein